jgi:GDP-mannose 4,6 dehydratase
MAFFLSVSLNGDYSLNGNDMVERVGLIAGGTGRDGALREFVEAAFERVGRRIVQRGAGVDEHGVDTAPGHFLIEIDPRYFRPTKVDLPIGDADIDMISRKTRPVVRSAKQPTPSSREVHPA